MIKKYNYLIVGAGLYGSIFAYEMNKMGKKCLVIDKRNHIGGNIYTEELEGINVHKYGAHIFHTSNKKVWEYINQFCKFNNYINSPIANYKGEIYNLPFNMNTFNKLWGVVTPEEAKAKIEEQKKEFSITEPKNLEEQAISLIGKDIYEHLFSLYFHSKYSRLYDFFYQSQGIFYLSYSFHKQRLNHIILLQLLNNHIFSLFLLSCKISSINFK